MTRADEERLKALADKETLNEVEFAQYQYLQRKRKNDERVLQFRQNQAEPYSSKRSRAVNLAWEFYKHPDVNGMCYVAVGGLDSITLCIFLRSTGDGCVVHMK